MVEAIIEKLALYFLVCQLLVLVFLNQLVCLKKHFLTEMHLNNNLC